MSAVTHALRKVDVPERLMSQSWRNLGLQSVPEPSLGTIHAVTARFGKHNVSLSAGREAIGGWGLYAGRALPPPMGEVARPVTGWRLDGVASFEDAVRAVDDLRGHITATGTTNIPAHGTRYQREIVLLQDEQGWLAANAAPYSHHMMYGRHVERAATVDSASMDIPFMWRSAAHLKDVQITNPHPQLRGLLGVKYGIEVPAGAAPDAVHSRRPLAELAAGATRA